MSIIDRWNADSQGFLYGFSQCINCKHLIDYKSKSCKAFEEIPKALLNNDEWHDKPYLNQDNEIIFEPK